MKDVGILLLVALLLNGCGTSSTTVQTASGGTWEANLSGGDGMASGFSFITQFTVGGNGALSVSSFQFITAGTCFPVTGGTQSGTLTATTNSANQVTGTFSFTESSGGNTLTLTSTSVTGTLSGTTLTGGSITGTWSIQGGTGCNNAGGTFTMKQS